MDSREDRVVDIDAAAPQREHGGSDTVMTSAGSWSDRTTRSAIAGCSDRMLPPRTSGPLMSGTTTAARVAARA